MQADWWLHIPDETMFAWDDIIDLVEYYRREGIDRKTTKIPKIE
jgi:hypothetical protein